MIPASERFLVHSPGAQRTDISSCVEHIKDAWEGGWGDLYLAAPYPGVSIWSNDIHIPSFTLRHLDSYHYLKINYCLSGRCEVPLEDGRFVYLESGILSIDLNQTAGSLSLPSGAYQGFGIIADLSALEEDYPAAWRECGIELADFRERFSGRNGSFLGRVSPQLDSLARKMTEYIRQGSLTIEEYRYHLLRLLWLLKEDGHTEEIISPSFLTLGQRALVAQAARLLTEDLSARITIEAAAGSLGISASSLKKYFSQVYGKPISVYLREKRMEYAKQLLSEPKLSIAAVAGSAGYENPGKFSAAFRTYTGTSPSEYRRLCLAGQKEKGSIK